MIAVLLTISLVAMLAGCANANDEGGDDEESYAEEETTELEEDDFDEVESEADEELTEPETSEEVSGLIFMRVDSASSEFQIVGVDPETLEEREIADFSIRQLLGGSEEYRYTIPYKVPCYHTRREWFSPEYDKMALSRQSQTNSEQHAGWADREGNYFDVTEALGLAADNEFTDAPTYGAVGFVNEYFVYYEWLGNTDYKYFYVPVDNLSADAVACGLPCPYAIYDQDSEVAQHLVTDWLNDHTIICNDTLVDISTWEETEYLVENSRENWNGVASPDGQQIAFMSATDKMKSGELFIANLPMDTPQKVPVDFLLASRDESQDSHKAFYNEADDMVSILIDWQ